LYRMPEIVFRGVLRSLEKDVVLVSKEVETLIECDLSDASELTKVQ
jgi:hypothetical protein